MATACSSYYPSEVETQRFWSEELRRKRACTDVPYGFPREINSPLAWKGLELEAKQSEWRLELTAEDITAVNSALLAFEAKYDNLSSISASTFELPAAFAQQLRRVSHQLYNGLGFQVIHGLDPSKYTAKQQTILYAGISAHICPQRNFVDVLGKEVIGHVVNVQGRALEQQSAAPAFSNVPLSFHTDNCEIMAFFYKDIASTGGETLLTSSWQIYNELAATRPDVLHTLAKQWVLDSFKPYSLQPPRNVPLLQKPDNAKIKVLLRFSRFQFIGWQEKRNPDLPAPTQAQLEAADAVQFIGMKNAIKLPMVKGDMLFVNDMTLMHARNGFDEGGMPMKRHILKMYLRDPSQGWALPLSVENVCNSANQPNGSKEESWRILYEPGLEKYSIANG